MTLVKEKPERYWHKRFAVVPHKCSRCDRRFVFEWAWRARVMGGDDYFYSWVCFDCRGLYE